MASCAPWRPTRRCAASSSSSAWCRSNLPRRTNSSVSSPARPCAGPAWCARPAWPGRNDDMLKKTARCMLAAIALVSIASGAAAENYPARGVTLVAPYAAGGGADLVARLLAQKFSDRLGQPFVGENRLRAGGGIAAAAVAQAAPHGYNLVLCTRPQVGIHGTLRQKLPYHPRTPFTALP